MQEQDFSEPILRTNCGGQDDIPKAIDGQLVEQRLFVIKNTEQRLWENIRKGDQRALGELYKLYAESLFFFGTGITKDRTYIMDCIHDLFLDLYKYRKGLSPLDNVKFYLFKSLKRKINRKYHSKTMPLLPIEAENRPEENHGFATSHEEHLINNECKDEKNKMLTKALGSLTKNQRKGLMLKFTEQRSYKEISEIMGVSIESARTLIYRALKSLR